MPRKKHEAVWVIMGPEPHFATCLRCKEAIPPPKMPCPMDALCLYVKYVIALHKHCKEGDAPVVLEKVTYDPS